MKKFACSLFAESADSFLKNGSQFLRQGVAGDRLRQVFAKAVPLVIDHHRRLNIALFQRYNAKSHVFEKYSGIDKEGRTAFSDEDGLFCS